MPYIPGKLPALKDSDAIALAQYLEDELHSLASGLIENVTEVALTPIFAAPKKPREGMVVYADGTLWNPGSGEGLYVYGSDNAWHFADAPTLPLSTANGGTGDTGATLVSLLATQIEVDAAWSTYTSTLSLGTGTGTIAARKKVMGKTVFVSVIITFTSAVTGVVSFTLPVATQGRTVIMGAEVVTIGHAAIAKTSASSATMTVSDATSGNFTATGSVILINGSYESV